MKTIVVLHLLLVILLFSGTSLRAQVTIGSNIEPVKGALLDLKEKIPSNPPTDNITSTGGLNLPRVNLTDLDNLYPMFETTPGSGTANIDYNSPAKKASQDANHTGLTVYNMNQSLMDVSGKGGPGIYVWNGTRWQYLM